jgi:hypothetical protein
VATPEQPGSGPVREAEEWFLAHGLPYFVDGVRAQVRERLSRPRVVLVLLVAVLVAAAGGLLVGLLSDSASFGLATGAWLILIVATAYAFFALRARVITEWALRRAFASLGLLFPLATRALPMLLLFVTFLFINTEVWQVTSAMGGGVLLGSVLFFGLAAVGFLLVRLDEELDQFDDTVDAETLLDVTADTPLAPTARRLVDEGADLQTEAQVTGLQRANLVLALLVAQAVQVLLLSLAAFCFFVLFGVVAIDDSVVKSWIGHDPAYPTGLHVVSRELAQVATFLAAFCGLYFTVYAVTDSSYRQQFFTKVMRELGRVVGVRICYRDLRRRADAVP